MTSSLRAFSTDRPVRIGIIGAGAVSDYHHVPGIRLDPRAQLVAACDTSAELLEQRRGQWGIDRVTTDPEVLCADPDVDAVIIATPNFTHRPIALAAARGGKHVMCEKPLGLNAGEVREMYHAVRDAGVVHMTAFTYRFAPAMRYLKHLVASGALGEPRHFRSQRFLDWPETSWGWRQYKDKAGAGDLFDMTIHRIDFAQDLLGRIESLCGAVARFAPGRSTADGGVCPPSDVDDWSSIIGQFSSGATGVWEGTTLAKGYGRDGYGHEWAEINGSEASAVYRLHEPNTILLGRTGHDLAPVEVPGRVAQAGRQPAQPGRRLAGHGVSLRSGVGIRVGDRRAARRGAQFLRWLLAQIVADAVLESYAQRRWVEIPAEPR